MKTYGIVLLPDKKTEAHVRSLGKRVGRNLICFPPAHVHLSLLHVALRARQIASLKKQLQTTKLPEPFSATCYRVAHSAGGWSSVKVRKSKKLNKLQHSVLSYAKLRAADTGFTWREHASAAQKRMYAKFGYPNVGDAWHPHFTFARTDPARKANTALLRRRVVFEHIALAELGDHGTVVKLLCMRTLPPARL